MGTVHRTRKPDVLRFNLLFWVSCRPWDADPRRRRVPAQLSLDAEAAGGVRRPQRRNLPPAGARNAATRRSPPIVAQSRSLDTCSFAVLCGARRPRPARGAFKNTDQIPSGNPSRQSTVPVSASADTARRSSTAPAGVSSRAGPSSADVNACAHCGRLPGLRRNSNTLPRGGADLNALDIKHAHGRLLKRHHAPSQVLLTIGGPAL